MKKTSKRNTLNKRGGLFGNKGFTLIELIVVIAVIGVLVLLAAPKLLSYTEEAKLAQIKNDTKVVEDAVHLYMVDNDDQLPEDAGIYEFDDLQTAIGENRVFNYKGSVAELADVQYYDVTGVDVVKDVNGKLDGEFVISSSGDMYYVHTSSFNTGGGDGPVKEVGLREPSEGEKEIHTAEELFNIGKDPAYPLDGDYILMADIDLSAYSEGEGWVPIGLPYNSSGNYDAALVFQGSFDGNGFVISNLTINRPSTNYQGLFGRTEGATIENVGLESVDVTGRDFIGGLVGYARSSTISNSYASGTVTGSGIRVGGLVGYVYSSTNISNSYASGAVTGSSNVGGLVGQAFSSEISNSYASGPVTGSSYVGGLVGRADTSTNISNSYASGPVTGSSNVGGLVGYNSSSTATNSYYDKDTTGRNWSAIGEGKTTTEMKTQLTYTGWDFDTIWQITPDNYPTLR